MRKGFTLIELLVVIFIIGLLASIVVVNVNNARIRARDSRRVADIDSMRAAVELFVDNNGVPPGADATTYASNNNNWNVTAATNLQTLLNTGQTYLNVLPRDPRNGAAAGFRTADASNNCIAGTGTATYRYEYRRAGNDYELRTMLEALCNGININDGGDDNDWYEVGTDPGLNLL